VPIPLPAGLGTGVAIVVAGGAAASVPVVRYRRWAYTLRDDDLWIRSGLLWVTVSVIPLYRLQFVDTRQGPLDRLLGLAQLVVHTAAPGTSGRLPGLDSAEAETLREQLAEHQPDAAAPV
jgi:membrane protein YdbS with pleckstrin-like domain